MDEGKNSPRPGYNLTLTINERVQYIAEKELDEVMEKYSPLSAIAVVMDPNTGEMLAMANRPGLQPKQLVGLPARTGGTARLRTSTSLARHFKLVTASGALEEGVVKPTDIIDCGNGEIEVGRDHTRRGKGRRAQDCSARSYRKATTSAR